MWPYYLGEFKRKNLGGLLLVNLRDYGFIPEMLPQDISGIPARITAVHKERYEIVCEYGETFASLKAGVYYNDRLESFPTTGDFVLIQYNPSGISLIIKTLARKSKFSRNDFSGHAVGYVKTVLEQVVAANFDYVFIMASLNKDFNISRIERYLTLSWQSGALPVVVLTKADLVDDFTEQVDMVKKIALGVDVFVVSAKTGFGIDNLSSYLKPGRTIVFLGSSGVGKSSLVNTLAGKEIMKVNEIREDDSKGRHTTTHRQLIKLNNGVMIIDTPGMRELGLWNVTEGLGETFSDVEAFFGKCKFSNCSHLSEPGCAIKAAIENGDLALERWNSYLKLKKETGFCEDKAEYIRKKTEWCKSIAKYSKELKKRGKV